MNYRMLLYLTGQILRVLGIAMLLPTLVALLYWELGSLAAFGITAGCLLFIGTLITIHKPPKTDLYAREGLAIVAVCWIAVSLFGAVPFFLTGEIPNFADCIFETVSGFTTTGATILKDVESLSKASLFWRSFTHWLGGMGVLVLMLAILPQNDTRTMHIVRAESPGPTVGKLAAKMSLSVRLLYVMYIAMTLLETVLLLFGGMSLFEALCHTFSTAGTGGFGVTNNSIADYNSVYIDIVITIFMGLFAINFTVYHLLLLKKYTQAFKNEELRCFLGICAVSTLIISLNIIPNYGDFFTALRYAVFQVFSIISTTGFATADYTEWPFLSQLILILLMFVGGCAGSTGGGLKVTRVMTLFKTAIKEVRTILNPRAVITVKCDGKALDQNTIKGVCSYFVVFSFVLVASILLLSLDGHDAGTTVTAAITCLNNVGPGIAEVAPSGNFSGFSEWAKLLLSFDMLLGRLEIYPMLILFSMKRK